MRRCNGRGALREAQNAGQQRSAAEPAHSTSQAGTLRCVGACLKHDSQRAALL